MPNNCVHPCTKCTLVLRKFPSIRNAPPWIDFLHYIGCTLKTTAQRNTSQNRGKKKCRDFPPPRKKFSQIYNTHTHHCPPHVVLPQKGHARRQHRALVPRRLGHRGKKRPTAKSRNPRGTGWGSELPHWSRESRGGRCLCGRAGGGSEPLTRGGGEKLGDIANSVNLFRSRMLQRRPFCFGVRWKISIVQANH